MMKRRKICSFAALIVGAPAMIALGGCAQEGKLVPLADQSMPVPPRGAAQSPDADALLEMRASAAPDRSVELRRRSEERADDPYDLPPPEA